MLNRPGLLIKGRFFTAIYDVNVIGGGPGGLCNVAILAKNGKKVLLSEKDPQIGSRAVTISPKGTIS